MLQIDIHPPIARVTLDRPEVHNAFDSALTSGLTAAFKDLGSRADLRAIVLAGNGKSFSAGGDLGSMRRTIDDTFAENVAGARALAAMFEAVADCPKAVIARVHGAALGGGAGLVAAADIAIAVRSAVFGFTEVRLGLVPGVISVFVIPRIGAGRAREYFTTGERFEAGTAERIGLVHQVVPDAAALDAAVEKKVEAILAAAPGAVAATKTLISRVRSMPYEEAVAYSTEALARARVGEEGQAGMKAFLEGKKPPWVKGE